jgi:hypothetical protein
MRQMHTVSSPTSQAIYRLPALFIISISISLPCKAATTDPHLTPTVLGGAVMYRSAQVIPSGRRWLISQDCMDGIAIQLLLQGDDKP